MFLSITIPTKLLSLNANSINKQTVTFMKFTITYLLTPRYRVLPEQLTGLQLLKKFPEFQGTRRFINALTSVRHLSLSWASPIQSTYPHPTSWRSILILSTHLLSRSPKWPLSLQFPHQDPIQPLSSPIRAKCPIHLILLDFITRTILGEEYKLFSFSLCNLLHSSNMKLINNKFKSGGLHKKHVVATWNVENRLSVCLL